jgi:hypothetical protein
LPRPRNPCVVVALALVRPTSCPMTFLMIARRHVDNKPLTRGPMRAQVGKFTLAGNGLRIGIDSGDNVSQEYVNPGTFSNGTILGVGVDISPESYLDMEREAAGALARD